MYLSLSDERAVRRSVVHSFVRWPSPPPSRETESESKGVVLLVVCLAPRFIDEVHHAKGEKLYAYEDTLDRHKRNRISPSEWHTRPMSKHLTTESIRPSRSVDRG